MGNEHRAFSLTSIFAPSTIGHPHQNNIFLPGHHRNVSVYYPVSCLSEQFLKTFLFGFLQSDVYWNLRILTTCLGWPLASLSGLLAPAPNTLLFAEFLLQLISTGKFSDHIQLALEWHSTAILSRPWTALFIYTLP